MERETKNKITVKTHKKTISDIAFDEKEKGRKSDVTDALPNMPK